MIGVISIPLCEGGRVGGTIGILRVLTTVIWLVMIAYAAL